MSLQGWGEVRSVLEIRSVLIIGAAPLCSPRVAKWDDVCNDWMSRGLCAFRNWHALVAKFK